MNKAVCIQTDCLLHPSNPWREKANEKTIKIIKDMANESMTIDFFNKHHFLAHLLYESSTLPWECIACEHFTKRDMKTEFLTEIAKAELLDENM